MKHHILAGKLESFSNLVCRFAKSPLVLSNVICFFASLRFCGRQVSDFDFVRALRFLSMNWLRIDFKQEHFSSGLRIIAVLVISGLAQIDRFGSDVLAFQPQSSRLKATERLALDNPLTWSSYHTRTILDGKFRWSTESIKDQLPRISEEAELSRQAENKFEATIKTHLDNAGLNKNKQKYPFRESQTYVTEPDLPWHYELILYGKNMNLKVK